MCQHQAPSRQRCLGYWLSYSKGWRTRTLDWTWRKDRQTDTEQPTILRVVCLLLKDWHHYFYTALVSGLGATIGVWIYNEIKTKYHVGFAGPGGGAEGLVSCIEGCLGGGGGGGEHHGGHGRGMRGHHGGHMMMGGGGGPGGGHHWHGGGGGGPPPGGPMGGPPSMMSGGGPPPSDGGGGPPMMGGGPPPGGPGPGPGGPPGFAMQPWQYNAPIPGAEQAADPWHASYLQYPSAYYVVEDE